MKQQRDLCLGGRGDNYDLDIQKNTGLPAFLK
jgi:hypothetical protein